MRPTVRSGQLLRMLVVAIAGIQLLSLAANLVGRFWQLEPFPRFDWFLALLDVDQEDNLPSWFSTALLLGTAGVLWHAGVRYARSRLRYARHWKLLAVIFAFLSLDEAAQIHEAGNAVGDGVSAAAAVPRSWVLVAAPFVIVFALAYLRFLLHLPRRVGWLVAAAGVGFVGGAIGMELLGALVGVPDDGTTSLGYLLAVAVEESLEMVSVAVFLYAVTLHLERFVPQPSRVPAARTAPAVPPVADHDGGTARHGDRTVAGTMARARP